MNKDQVAGRAEELKGKIKEETGKIVGNENLEAEGKLDKLTGKAQAALGDGKNKVADKIEKL